MKTAAPLVVASILSASMMLTLSVHAQSYTPAAAPPPPGINDPGVKAVSSSPAAVAPAAAATAARPDLHPLTLPAMKSGDSRMGRPDDVPDVQVRRQGDNTVQEYSRSGRVYMIVVTPKNGIQQTYMVDPQGRVVDEHGQKPIGPVMYKILEWGKSKPPAEPAADADAGTPASAGSSGH
ncbi:MAG TPA: DUF2782 domain-containing protein [Rhodanobacter sp.]|nr:DUF2782 domain-containing protein [Rhodanobacter sp.]